MTVRGSTHVAGSVDVTNTTIIVPVPAEAVDGDTLTMFLMYDDLSCEPASISGWTNLGDGASSTTASVPAYSVWQRTASSEPGSYTATLGAPSSRGAGFMVASDADLATSFSSRHSEVRINDVAGAKTDTQTLAHDAGIGTAGGQVFYLQILQASFYTTGTSVLTPDAGVVVLESAESVSVSVPTLSQMHVVLSHQVANDGPASSWGYAYTDTFHSGGVCMVVELVGWTDHAPLTTFQHMEPHRVSKKVSIAGLPHDIRTGML